LLAKGYQTAGPPDAFQDQAGRVRTVFFFDPDGKYLGKSNLVF
jgi:hypothetical protein